MILSLLFSAGLCASAPAPEDTVSFRTLFYNDQKIYSVNEVLQFMNGPDTVLIRNADVAKDELSLNFYSCMGGHPEQIIIRNAQDEKVSETPPWKKGEKQYLPLELPVRSFLSASDKVQFVKLCCYVEIWDGSAYTETERTLCILRFEP